ncbi:MFS transporter [Candidatus Cardinium hertigii]|uniref:Proline/betaine transporter n=1 Tax=Candidatus Cardinium hertigii TaxID=247481 RepID=A0A2Z3LE55_9BACT|nr:MFS transporter [Candidatus Cardinium hertigii]AWN82016.1 Proline/betaine transporter [Candidatus Cardinium hertigii]
MHELPRRRFIGAFLGIIVEYYDFSLYIHAASKIMQHFFPTNGNHMLHFWAIYAVPYIAKPIGALLFGKIGDVYGRKIALNITTIGIFFPTMLMGLLPSYTAMGIWSPVMLTLCKFVQGIFFAGGYDSAAIYVIEHMGEKYKATASALARCTCVMGLLFALGMVHICSLPCFPVWGWRCPFLFSLPLALITLYYQKRIDETPDFQKAKKDQAITYPLIDLLKGQWRTIGKVICITGGSSVAYQISILFMPKFLSKVLPHISDPIASYHTTGVFICFAVGMLISGILADKLDYAIVFKVSMWGVILTSIGLGIAIIQQITSMALITSLLLASCVAPFVALIHGIIIQAFPVNERNRSISLGHTIGSMLMSSSACMICAAMVKTNCTLFPLIYTNSAIVLAYDIISRLRLYIEMRKRN